VVAGLGAFGLVRTLESARSIQSPSMGLLRRPTPGEIVEGGRFSRPYGPGTHSRNLRKPVRGFAANPSFLQAVSVADPNRRIFGATVRTA
jgi:hypothetical protein